jgi:hypothetical protein
MVKQKVQLKTEVGTGGWPELYSLLILVSCLTVISAIKIPSAEQGFCFKSHFAYSIQPSFALL